MVALRGEEDREGAEKYAMQVKGLELPGYDIRALKGHVSALPPLIRAPITAGLCLPGGLRCSIPGK